MFNCIQKFQNVFFSCIFLSKVRTIWRSTLSDIIIALFFRNIYFAIPPHPQYNVGCVSQPGPGERRNGRYKGKSTLYWGEGFLLLHRKKNSKLRYFGKRFLIVFPISWKNREKNLRIYRLNEWKAPCFHCDWTGTWTGTVPVLVPVQCTSFPRWKLPLWNWYIGFNKEEK